MKKTLLACLLALMVSLSVTASFAATDPAAIGKKDGSYTVKLDLKGGDVDASVAEPVFLRVENGKGYASVAWENKAYDKLIVDGETFLPLKSEETKTFEIPVTAYDKVMKVTAVAGEEETEYGMTFSSGGIHKVRTPKDYLLVVVAMFAVFLIAVLVSVKRIKAAPSQTE